MNRIIYKALIDEGWTFDEEGRMALIGREHFERAAERVARSISAYFKRVLPEAIYATVEDLLVDCVGQAEIYPMEPVMNFFDHKELADRIVNYLSKR